jgi:hypothetical protein
MAKISKKNMKKKGTYGSKKSTTLSKKGKSKEMKKGKKGGKY